ncbi:hypothetical protein A2767_04405 [Candidatus Roizmanbacteria bacterium RIFCSPHIGHO2_01_FULL_35_10]|uniref:Uncharacterized protein n=1 Tax=Candidatus Roizmanbacteria bacterium RIFCSPLOWO2_01_FULL_35_13 TaxID=1802055 RepID=A0A1F7I8I6_9BACT|nr:MAG: hypothetical protein A2767_04405 [Candidatus Roizmanbacteria bacterium RIFCSPHIGHO2_01_FULL_35_10]OGK39670.1 MAG: hypothetical protein A3A74_07850 [Candidatus Roizmanbacteria bacterium RIFCSPLOWO2_01_FULL_35_13]
MARISKLRLEEHVLNKLFDLFFEVVGKKSDKDQFQKITRELLSPVERIMVAKRIAIVYLLLKKIDYRIICDVLKVSSATISRYNLLLQNSDGLVPAFNNILRNDKLLLFMDELFNALFPPGTYGTNWKSTWQRKFRIQREKTEGI